MPKTLQNHLFVILIVASLMKKASSNFICSDFLQGLEDDFDCIEDKPFYFGNASILFELKGKREYKSDQDYILKINQRFGKKDLETEAFKATESCPYFIKVNF